MRDINDVVSNERLEKLSEYDCADRHEVMSMATELLALRKEREKAEPVAWLVCGSKTLKDRTTSTREVAEQAVKDRKDGSTVKPLYTAPPAPVVPVSWDGMPFTWEQLEWMHGVDFANGYVLGWKRKCESVEMKGPLYTAPVVPDLERLKEIYSIFCTPTTGSDNALSAIHNACRTAMLNQK